MRQWNTTVRVTKDTLKILVTNESGEDLVRAKLPLRPGHPRALVTLLEGLALWARRPLPVVISAVGQPDTSVVSDLFDAAMWPTENALLRLSFAGRPARRRRLRGLGDFRALYAIEGHRSAE